eukprot:TRINITY_DN5777_c0_g1_i1.p1 TRINITY_DN5777_c0_g1~~TRINITY_DN5777_c0_g1_i1.p1  ORF type:complete len:217 (+),score=77.53 TRINITY_DN5777_c0_g1_i1:79-651(+)
MPKVDISDYGGPKRPLTAYFMFLADHREEITKACGSNNPAQVSKEAGKRWSEISPADKKKYDDQVAKAKTKYEADMEKFKKSPKHQEWVDAVAEQKEAKAEKGARKGTKRAREEGEPKRPQTAYFLWLNSKGRKEAQEEKPDAKTTEIAQLCGELWKGMSDAEKKPYEEQATKAKAQYAKDMKAFQARKK